MKNAFIALALVLVCSTAFASKEAETKARLQKIASTPFGKTILETIQVELKSKDDPRPRIIELLEDLESQLIQAQATEDSNFQASTDHYNARVASIEGELSELSDDLAENTQVVADTEAAIEEATANLETKNSVLDTYTAQLDAAQSHWEGVEADCDAADHKYGRILDVLGQVRGVITQRLATRYDQEFLQSGHQQMIGAFAQIKESVQDKAFKKLSPGFSKLIAFITMKVESHITQVETDADEEAVAELTSIVTLIDSIAAGVEQERVAYATLKDNELAAWEDAESTLNAAISDVNRDIDNLDNSLTDLNAQLATANTQIEQDENRVADLEDQLATENANQQNLANGYSRDTHDRTAQLQLIQEVLDIVNNQLTGLRQYAEDYIANN
jgi:chromosome segregation ATPase